MRDFGPLIVVLFLIVSGIVNTVRKQARLAQQRQAAAGLPGPKPARQFGGIPPAPIVGAAAPLPGTAPAPRPAPPAAKPPRPASAPAYAASLDVLPMLAEPVVPPSALLAALRNGGQSLLGALIVAQVLAPPRALRPQIWPSDTL